MKQLVTVLCGTCLLTSFAYGESTKLSLHVWNRHTLTMIGDSIKENASAIKRGYLSIKHKFTDKIKARFTLDFFSSDDYKYGAGIKLKYGYIDIERPIAIPSAKLTFGLIKTYFGKTYDWTYPTITKVLEEKEKLIASADYGIAIFGYLPRGYGEYALSILNGEGYKKTGDKVNIHPAYVANVRVIPIPGITIGGSLFYEKAGIGEYENRLLYAGMVQLIRRPFNLWVEYLRKSGGSTSEGYMVVSIFNLRETIGRMVELVARYDKWDEDIHQSNDAHSRIIVGSNWHMLPPHKGKPTLMLQVNWEHTEFENANKPEDRVMLQLRWVISTKISR